MVLATSTSVLSSLNLAYGQQDADYYVYVDPLPEWATSYASNTIHTATKAWEDAYELQKLEYG